MDGLRTLDAAYARWYLKGCSRTDALRHEVTSTDAAVDAALTVNRRDTDGTPIEDLGFYFNVWSGAADDVALTMDCNFNVTTPYVKSSVVLGLPERYEDDLVSAQLVLDLVAAVWQPDEGNVWNGDHEELLRM